MTRGIWENSLLKIFLTRGPLGTFFRPLLYSCEEQMHFSFLNPLTDLADAIIAIADCRKRMIAYYWLCEVPRKIFEEIVLPDDTGYRLCRFLPDAEPSHAEDIAYLTQGYILSYLERILKVDHLFNETLNISLRDLEAIIDSAYGSPNKVAHYRRIFDEKAEQSSPADYPANFVIHHYYGSELLRSLAFSAATGNLPDGDMSRQLRNLSMTASRKLQAARYNTLLMLEDMKQSMARLSYDE